MIKDNLDSINANIREICEGLGRDPQEVVLVGATKYSEVDQIKEAISAGLAHIAENRVQDAKKKFPPLDDLEQSFTKHMIGHLQTNKVKNAIQLFDVIQSVDSQRLAKEIEAQAQKQEKVVDVLIQVNTSGEAQKFGIDEEDAWDLIKEVAAYEHVNLKGLMTMAPLTVDSAAIRECFAHLKQLFDQAVQEFGPQIQYLSMGMSSDYKIALEEGANMIRIGSAIFK